MQHEILRPMLPNPLWETKAPFWWNDMTHTDREKFALEQAFPPEPLPPPILMDAPITVIRREYPATSFWIGVVSAFIWMLCAYLGFMIGVGQ